MKIAPQFWYSWVPSIHTSQIRFLNVFSESGTSAKMGNLSRFQNNKEKFLVIHPWSSVLKVVTPLINWSQSCLLSAKFLTKEKTEYHLEPLKLLLSLHWCNWWGWMSMTLYHLASMGLHSCWVMMAAMNCCYGGTVTATRALWNSWNLGWMKYIQESSRLVHFPPNVFKEHACISLHTQR